MKKLQKMLKYVMYIIVTIVIFSFVFSTNVEASVVDDIMNKIQEYEENKSSPGAVQETPEVTVSEFLNSEELMAVSKERSEFSKLVKNASSQELQDVIDQIEERNISTADKWWYKAISSEIDTREFKNYNEDQITEYVKGLTQAQIDSLPQDVKDAWKEKLMEHKDDPDSDKKMIYALAYKKLGGEEEWEGGSKPIYYSPEIKDKTRTPAESVDAIIENADNMLKKESKSPLVQEITPDALQDFSSVMYNILLVIGIAVAVLMGAVLGVKFLTASVEGKAQIKEWLFKYAVGCAIVFGAFAIWKLVFTILEQIT